jgi:membrane-bound lytic murein transglycosylase B
VQRLTTTAIAAAMILAAAAPASAFNMRKALQAVENLGQWSVMAQHCGEPDSANNIRQSILTAIRDAGISPRQRKKLTSELQYWVKTINRNFRNGGLNVRTACPIWQDSGQLEVKKEFARLHKQLG